MTRIFSLTLTLLLLASPVFAKSNQEKRDQIQEMSSKVLARLYKEQPETKDIIRKASGYATFSNIGVNVIFFSAGGGSGLVHNNKSGQETYMNMGTAGVGLGIGIKDFRAVFIFHDEKRMNSFIEDGWDFSGEADAAAKSGEKGAAGNAAGSMINGVSVYQLTENGLAISATLQGTKYWKSDKLNNK